MKVFLSWSGELSKRAAIYLKEWLPHVIHGLDTWVSSQDIPIGRPWAKALADELQDADFGIVCLVPGILDKPYINFEAGALSTGPVERPVTALLIGLAPSDVTGPLLQLQLTPYSHDGVHKLVKSLNAENPRGPLKDSILHASFEKWWPDLQVKLDPLLEEARRSAQDQQLLSRIQAGIERGIIGWRKGSVVVDTETFREIAQNLDRLTLAEDGLAFYVAAAIHYGEALDTLVDLARHDHPLIVARTLAAMIASYPHVRGIWRAAAVLEDLPSEAAEPAVREAEVREGQLDEERRLLFSAVENRATVQHLKEIYETATDDRKSMARQVLLQLKQFLKK